MTSNPKYDEAYVWVWLPNTIEPVVAGRLARQSDDRLAFNYGQSYLARTDAISIYEPELPLKSGALDFHDKMKMPSCIRDASPDAWGRRVIINRTLGLKGDDASQVDIDELTYLLESGSDRIGALDFQSSPNIYTPRQRKMATLEELMASAEKVEKGIPLSPELDLALQHGTSLGGARPKALIEDNATKHIAKFSTSTDLYNVVKVEFVAMRLAAHIGLNVAPVKLVKALGKDVLLVERFDRTHTTAGWNRHALVSALTILNLDESEARYASYEDLATLIRHRFTNPEKTLEELFSRIVFNILSGNTDDHARNHAAFWDGRNLTLTPAYDICPQGRTGGEATQAMMITGNKKYSKLTICLEAASQFLLTPQKAAKLINNQLNTIRNLWEHVCEEGNLTEIDRNFLWQRQFLNPYALEGFTEE